jgi:hypothetical protein
MSKVINITDEVYPVQDLIADVAKEIDEVEELLVIIINKDGTSSICHSGLSLAELAISSKMIDYEFNKLYSEYYIL